MHNSKTYKFIKKKIRRRAGGMAQQLRTCTALAEDQVAFLAPSSGNSQQPVTTVVGI